MSTVAIVDHSGYGHTHLQAEAVMRGVGASGRLDELDAAEAIILGFLTSMGSMSAVMKTLLQPAAQK